jgi:hypothetical protein
MEVKPNQVIEIPINFKPSNIFKTTVHDDIVLEVAAGTTGICSDDNWTYFSLIDCGLTMWELKVNNRVTVDFPEKIELLLTGDAELRVFIKALKFAVKVLEEQTR